MRTGLPEAHRATAAGVRSIWRNKYDVPSGFTHLPAIMIAERLASEIAR